MVWPPCSPKDSQESFPTLKFKKINSLAPSFFYGPTLTSIHDYLKNHSFDYADLCWQSNVSVLNMLSRLDIAFLLRCKCFLISRLQLSSAVILEPKKIVCHCFHYFPIYLPWSNGAECHDLSFLNVEWKSWIFHSSISPSSRGSLVPLCFLL